MVMNHLLLIPRRSVATGPSQQTIFVVNLGATAGSGGVTVSLDPSASDPDRSFFLSLEELGSIVESLINAVPESITDWTVVQDGSTYTFTSVLNVYERWYISADTTDTQEATIEIVQVGGVVPAIDNAILDSADDTFIPDSSDPSSIIIDEEA